MCSSSAPFVCRTESNEIMWNMCCCSVFVCCDFDCIQIHIYMYDVYTCVFAQANGTENHIISYKMSYLRHIPDQKAVKMHWVYYSTSQVVIQIKNKIIFELFSFSSFRFVSFCFPFFTHFVFDRILLISFTKF